MIKPEATVTIEPPFNDVDMMGVVWHGNYLRYFEIARSAMLESIHYSYREMKTSGLAWPVVDVRLRYMHAIEFGQRINVRARLTEYELRMRIDYLITDAEHGKRLTKGHTIQVPVDMATGELTLGTPDILYKKLGIEP